jgi:hypothetical protein
MLLPGSPARLFIVVDETHSYVDPQGRTVLMVPTGTWALLQSLITNSLTVASPRLVLPNVTPNDLWTRLDNPRRRASAPGDVASSPCVASQQRSSQERPGKRRRTDEAEEVQASSPRVRYFIS